MATIARILFSEHPVDARFWPALARNALDWAAQQHVETRDAIVLVPYAQLLAPARRAFAACGGWQPRVETTQTLRASLGPAPMPQVEQLRFDPASDVLVAQALLRRQAWARAWAERDAPAFEQAVRSLVTTAQALAGAAAALPPATRAAWHEAARIRLTPVDGPGAVERMLARMALEWAAASDNGDSDALFSLRPSAWMAVAAAGLPALTRGLLEHAGVPALMIDTDPAAEAPFDAAAQLAPPRRVVAVAFEGEAQAAALEVIEALRRGSGPVALIAHDRSLVRRVRALLDRADVSMRDETGWKLSTTRAAAQVMALLRAAHPRAGIDARLDWLKSDAQFGGGALTALEGAWRRGRAPGEAGTALWLHAQSRLTPLASAGTQALLAWQAALRAALGDLRALAADAAGAQLLAALRLDEPADEAWQALARRTRLGLEDFTAWVAAVLEDATFVPPDDGEAAVVITPLSRALLRPFDAVVFPGTDERRLGAGVPPDPLLGDALAREVGLPDTVQRRLMDTLAFAQLLRVPDVVLLRRAADGIEPLSDSPWVERAMVARQRAGLPVPQEHPATLPVRRIERAPVRRPAPGAAAGLPPSLSASAVEALRDCPYRFFARVVLRLGEARELDAPLEKRDYGSWIHALLHRFHEERQAPADEAAETQRLLALADELHLERGLDAAELMPYRVALEALAPAYVRWLHQRDAEGWSWERGEMEVRIVPSGLGGTGLHGVIDRLDRRSGVVQLIDYKTGAEAELRRKVDNPLEDTQLAFYAALVGAGDDAPLTAMYLALDERRGPREIVHDDVAASAQVLLDGLSGDLERIRAGSGLAALGEGRVCEFCEARGLCRRDDWTP
jgi:ATP-dependent helicase/nuclease subunit B